MRNKNYKYSFKQILSEIFCNKNNKKILFKKSIKLLKNFEKLNNLDTNIKIKLLNRSKQKDTENCCGFYFFGKNYIEIYHEVCEDLNPVREIKIKNKCIQRSILGTMLHEYGHYLNEYFELQFYGHYFKNADSKLIDEKYIHIYNDSKKYKVSNYFFMPADPMEDFAETFVFFILNPRWLKKHYPLKYDFFTKFLMLKPLHYFPHSEIHKLTYTYKCS